jgi:hypothetical protein
VQASGQAVETRSVSTAPAASVASSDGVDARVGQPPQARPGRPRISPRAIEFVGLGLAVALIAAVALDHTLSNDEFWQMASGQWMLGHHGVMGLDPYSYTEGHRRWVTDEWGSAVALAALFRAFGAWAYALYAIVLGGASLAVSMAYARTLGARGGRVAAIVLLLAFGISGVVIGDRGLDFSLVWFPLELLLLAKARTSPKWLLCLPTLCVAWVNTHGSVLIGLLVLGVELGWSLVPERAVARIGGTGQSRFTGSLALAFVGSLLGSCLTPYGPGLLSYDLGVSRNSQIGQYISEWNSPDFHSTVVLAVYLVPLAVLVACLWRRRFPVLEMSLGLFLFVEALQTQRLVVYLMLVAVGLAAGLPARPAWGTRARGLAGVGLAVLGLVLLAMPSVPAGAPSSSLPIRAFDALSTHPGRVFTEYTWGDYSIARHRQTFADGRTDLFEGTVLTEFFAITDMTIDPDPILSAYHVRYVVWAPGTSLSEFLSHDARWRLIDRTKVALVFARR